MLVDIGGVRLNVIEEGEGEPVLLLHGLGGSWRDWEPQLNGGLSRRYRSIVVEARGHGRSDRPPGAFRFALFAEDLAAVCKILGVERAHVIGHSMGGMIAQALALDHPDLVATLVLADTSGRTDARLRAANRAAAELIAANGLAAMLDGFESLMWGPRARAERHDLVRSYAREQGSNDPASLVRAMGAIAELDHLDRLQTVAQPALVVWGEEDTLTPREHAEALALVIPSAELVTMPGCGHLTILEDPDRFSAIVLEFLAEHPLPA